MRFLKSISHDDRGANMVEYGLIAAVIALVAMSAVTLLGEKTDETFTTVAVALEDEAAPSGEQGEEGEQGSNGSDESSGGGDATPGDQSGGDQAGDDQAGDDQQGQDEGDDAGDEQHDQQGGDAGVDEQEGSGDDNDDDTNSGSDDGANGDDDANGGSGDGSGDPAGGSEDELEEEDEAEPAPVATGTASQLYWWDGNAKKGQWKADVSYSNDTDRHQYLTLEVTQVDDRGKTTKSTVNSFYVGAGGSSTYTVWGNDINKNQKNVKGIVEVRVVVVSVRTSDANWQPYSYEVDGAPTSVLPPELP